MITFKQFICEADPKSNSMNSSELTDLLMNDCDYFLNESSQQGVLVRGMKSFKGQAMSMPHPRDLKSDDVTFSEIIVRQARSPTDTPIKTHEMLDAWFNDHFGFKARSQAVFCMGGSERGVRAISNYGRPHIVMPIGKFKYVWSPIVDDLYARTAGIAWDRDYDENDEDNYAEPEKMIDKFMSAHNYTDKRLDAAVVQRYEIMIACSKYYAFKYEHRKLLEDILDIK